MKFKAIIFDMDGTIFDSLEDIADSMNTVLKENGYSKHPVDAYRQFIGDGIELLVKRALPESEQGRETIRYYVKAMRNEYAKRWTLKTRPYPGISKMIDECISEGLKLAVLTNKLEDSAIELIDRLLPEKHFDYIWGARSQLPKKPDPAGALLLIRQMNLRPSDCIYLGDMPVDMKTALSAEIYALGALWGYRTADELFEAGAQAVLRQPVDLLPWL